MKVAAYVKELSIDGAHLVKDDELSALPLPKYLNIALSSFMVTSLLKPQWCQVVA